MFWFASLKTTELAPLDVVTPVPPFATATIPVVISPYPNTTAPTYPLTEVTTSVLSIFCQAEPL